MLLSLAIDMLCIVCRRGDLLHALTLLDEEEDINKVLKYFSYEHFYVIYCKVRPAQHVRHTRGHQVIAYYNVIC